MGMNHNANCSTERTIKASMIFRGELKRKKYEAVSKGVLTRLTSYSRVDALREE